MLPPSVLWWYYLFWLSLWSHFPSQYFTMSFVTRWSSEHGDDSNVIGDGDRNYKSWWWQSREGGGCINGCCCPAKKELSSPPESCTQNSPAAATAGIRNEKFQGKEKASLSCFGMHRLISLQNFFHSISKVENIKQLSHLVIEYKFYDLWKSLWVRISCGNPAVVGNRGLEVTSVA